MENLSPARAKLALLALALGGFSIGSTEFVAMGLLPDIARDLLPSLYVSDPEAAIGRAGWLITAYALGVVVGAPTIAAAVRPVPPEGRTGGPGHRLLGGHRGIGPCADVRLGGGRQVRRGSPARGLLWSGRAGGIPLLGPAKRGQAVAYVLVGLTIASVVGVPLITYLGQHAGWRAAYLVVALLFALTTVALIAFIPPHPGNPHATIRRELKAFTRPAVWAALLTASLGFGGFFAVYSYVSPLATEITGTSASFVPIVLMVSASGPPWGFSAGAARASLWLGSRHLRVCSVLLRRRPWCSAFRRVRWEACW